jgi:hypothetical protein
LISSLAAELEQKTEEAQNSNKAFTEAISLNVKELKFKEETENRNVQDIKDLQGKLKQKEEGEEKSRAVVDSLERQLKQKGEDEERNTSVVSSLEAHLKQKGD